MTDRGVLVSRVPIVLLAAAAFLGAAQPVAAGPGVRLEEREAVVVTVRSLSVPTHGGPADGLFRIELRDGKPGRTELRLAWPDADSVSRAVIRAEPRPPRPGGRSVVTLRSELALPDGRTQTATRDLIFTDSGTALFELGRAGGRSLTLAVEAELRHERSWSTRPAVGAPVLFFLEVQWVENGRERLLETNRMSTFVGEPVSYSFRLGEVGEAEALEVTLTPLRLYGDVIQIQLEVSGTLPDGDRVELVSRREEWLASRGNRSTFDVGRGDPPTGFRFVVTSTF